MENGTDNKNFTGINNAEVSLLAIAVKNEGKELSIAEYNDIDDILPNKNALTKQKLSNVGICITIGHMVMGMMTFPQVINFLRSPASPIQLLTKGGGGNTGGLTTHVTDPARGAPKIIAN